MSPRFPIECVDLRAGQLRFGFTFNERGDARFPNETNYAQVRDGILTTARRDKRRRAVFRGTDNRRLYIRRRVIDYIAYRSSANRIRSRVSRAVSFLPENRIRTDTTRRTSVQAIQSSDGTTIVFRIARNTVTIWPTFPK